MSAPRAAAIVTVIVLASGAVAWLGGCGISPAIDGRIDVRPDNEATPEQVAEERKKLAGAFERDQDGAAVGEIAYLTLGEDGRFDRGRCSRTPCDKLEHQSGTFDLSQSLATGTWKITFVATDPVARPGERYGYHYVSGGLKLQLDGSQLEFTMQRIDDRDGEVDPKLSMSETDRLVGAYRSDDTAPSPGDLLRLTLDEQGRFTRSLCEESPCGEGTAQAGAFSITKGLTTSALYVGFTLDGASSPADRYAYTLSAGTLKLRRVGTARWFPMER